MPEAQHNHIGPVLAWPTEGKLEVEWVCPACEPEGEKETIPLYPLNTTRKIELPEDAPIGTCPDDIDERET